MFGDSNGQIKLRAKQKFKFLSATNYKVFCTILPGILFSDYWCFLVLFFGFEFSQIAASYQLDSNMGTDLVIAKHKHYFQTTTSL